MLLLYLALFALLPFLAVATYDTPKPNGKIVMTDFVYKKGIYTTKWNLTKESPGCFDMVLMTPGFSTLTLAVGADSSCLEFTGNVPNVFQPGYQKLLRRQAVRGASQIVMLSDATAATTTTARLAGGPAPKYEIYAVGPKFVIEPSDFDSPDSTSPSTAPAAAGTSTGSHASTTANDPSPQAATASSSTGASALGQSGGSSPTPTPSATSGAQLVVANLARMISTTLGFALLSTLL